MRVTIQAFSIGSFPQRIIDSIPVALKRGKTLVAYVIGQEGDSQPVSLQTNSSLRLSWPRQAIERLASLANGVKLFNRHQEGTNDNTGRKSAGQVVASYLDNVGGKLSAIVVAPFESKPEEDVCSIEANIATREERSGFIVDTISALTGIAIGKGNEDSPAFAGARQIAAVQCFTPHQFNSQRSAHMEITFADVEEFVKTRKVWPSQLFDIKTIYQDNEFKEQFKTKFADPDRVKTLEEQLAEAQQKLNRYVVQEGRGKGKERVAEKLKENTTDAQREHILRAWEKNNLTDFSDAALDKFIAEEKKEYEYIVERFGTPKTKNPDDGKSEEEKASERKLEAVNDKSNLEDLATALLGG